MKQTVSCDICGLVMSASESLYDIGTEQDLCPKHAQEQWIQQIEREIAEKREWLERTHLAEIKALELKLRKIKGEA